MIEQLAEKEKHLQYTPKNKKTKGGDYSSYHRYWNKSVNKWVGIELVWSIFSFKCSRSSLLVGVKRVPFAYWYPFPSNRQQSS
jgi:hypothetical protein